MKNVIKLAAALMMIASFSTFAQEPGGTPAAPAAPSAPAKAGKDASKAKKHKHMKKGDKSSDATKQ